MRQGRKKHLCLEQVNFNACQGECGARQPDQREEEGGDPGFHSSALDRETTAVIIVTQGLSGLSPAGRGLNTQATLPPQLWVVPVSC